MCEATAINATTTRTPTPMMARAGLTNLFRAPGCDGTADGKPAFGTDRGGGGVHDGESIAVPSARDDSDESEAGSCGEDGDERDADGFDFTGGGADAASGTRRTVWHFVQRTFLPAAPSGARNVF